MGKAPDFSVAVYSTLLDYYQSLVIDLGVQFASLHQAALHTYSRVELILCGEDTGTHMCTRPPEVVRWLASRHKPSLAFI